jgi:hypothetical protein
MKKIDYKKITLEDLAGLISDTLLESNIDTVLVGGACVSIYTKNEYMSFDLDFVTHSTIKEISPILEKLGFTQEKTRHFVNKKCDYFIEFVSPPVSVGKDQAISKFNKVKTKKGVIKLFTPTDCVKDRLASYFHWNDPQSLEQAIFVAKKQKIYFDDIKEWSIKENAIDKYNKFLNLLKK